MNNLSLTKFCLFYHKVSLTVKKKQNIIAKSEQKKNNLYMLVNNPRTVVLKGFEP